ncbi:MAG: 6-bladed beta-propeller [Chitinophagaceae bacterium]|nr:6-bladed beta-propeller [Chitinophagaceae bacterium]
MQKNQLLIIISLIVLWSFLGSCNSDEDKQNLNYTEIHIDNSKIEEKIDLSDRIENISIVSLKETKGNFIGGIFKLFASNNKYIVYDRLNTNRINLFDAQGYFLKTVAKVGDSLNDPLNITDCWLNNKGQLEVYDYAQMKIFQYDDSFKLSNIIKSKQFNHFVSMHNIPGTSDYISYTNFNQHNEPYKGELYHIAILDSSLKIIKTDSNFDKSLQGVLWLVLNQYFFLYKDSLRFVQAFDNFIYDATNTGIKRRFKIQYKKNAIPDDITPIIKEHLGEFKNEEINPNVTSAYFKLYSRFAGGWLETDKYVYISSRDNKGEFGNYFFSLIDKRNNTELFSAREFSETEKYKLRLPPFQYIDAENAELIAIVNGMDLKEKLFTDSPFQSEVVADPEIFYLVKVKLK